MKFYVLLISILIIAYLFILSILNVLHIKPGNLDHDKFRIAGCFLIALYLIFSNIELSNLPLLGEQLLKAETLNEQLLFVSIPILISIYIGGALAIFIYYPKIIRVMITVTALLLTGLLSLQMMTDNGYLDSQVIATSQVKTIYENDRGVDLYLNSENIKDVKAKDAIDHKLINPLTLKLKKNNSEEYLYPRIKTNDLIYNKNNPNGHVEKVQLYTETKKTISILKKYNGLETKDTYLRITFDTKPDPKFIKQEKQNQKDQQIIKDLITTD